MKEVVWRGRLFGTAVRLRTAEKSPGAFILRIVTNEDVLNDIKKQCALDTFLRDVDQLYADFRGRFDEKRPKRIN